MKRYFRSVAACAVDHAGQVCDRQDTAVKTALKNGG
jgi:hypothetical protein